MEDQLISFETAKLAKEKGFNEPTINHWEIGLDGSKAAVFTSGDMLKNNELTPIYTINSVAMGEFSAPTQSLLQRWLREKHDLKVTITPDFYCYNLNVYHYIKILDRNELVYSSFKDFTTYEEALEDGLKEALKLIK